MPKHHFFVPNHFEKGQISGIWPQNANLATLLSSPKRAATSVDLSEWFKIKCS